MKLNLITLAASLVVASATLAAAQESASYTVTFRGTWSESTHPSDFPLLAHFSPVIGVTHDAQFELVRRGAIASPGLEKLAEEGKHQPLDGELRVAMANGHVGAIIETADPLRELPGEAMTTFMIDPSHPMVSLVAMIAPSPDWFAAALDVPLLENGEWKSVVRVPLVAHDAGTDSATSYRALDADMDPRGRIAVNPSAYFAGDRSVVGEIVLTRR